MSGFTAVDVEKECATRCATDRTDGNQHGVRRLHLFGWQVQPLNALWKSQSRLHHHGAYPAVLWIDDHLLDAPDLPIGGVNFAFDQGLHKAFRLWIRFAPGNLDQIHNATRLGNIRSDPGCCQSHSGLVDDAGQVDNAMLNIDLNLFPLGLRVVAERLGHIDHNARIHHELVDHGFYAGRFTRSGFGSRFIAGLRHMAGQRGNIAIDHHAQVRHV